MAQTPVEPGRQKSDVARQIVSVRADLTATAEITPRTLVSTAAVGSPGTVWPVDLDTALLVDEVVRTGYAGLAWAELARRLVRRALPDLESAIRTGAIYRRCARAGVSIPRRPVLQEAFRAKDIAAEAVEACLHRFQTRVLPEGGWDPERGTSLEAYFSVCCLPDVANRWRWYLRRLPEAMVALDGASEGAVVALALDPGPGPAEIAEQQSLVAEALAPMAERDQAAFVMLAAGWTSGEIARVLGVARNTLDARISRARKAARARRTP